jgi:hypothetical protein
MHTVASQLEFDQIGAIPDRVDIIDQAFPIGRKKVPGSADFGVRVPERWIHGLPRSSSFVGSSGRKISVIRVFAKDPVAKMEYKRAEGGVFAGTIPEITKGVYSRAFSRIERQGR